MDNALALHDRTDSAPTETRTSIVAQRFSRPAVPKLGNAMATSVGDSVDLDNTQARVIGSPNDPSVRYQSGYLPRA